MIRLACVALVVLFASACLCTARIIQVTTPSLPGAPPAPGHDIIALLQEPETGKVGRVVISSPLGGSVELHDARVATRVVIGQPPSVAFKFSKGQIQQLYGDALAALPPAPRHFLLYFNGGSNQLTPQSEKLLAAIPAFVNSQAVPDVTVVGHTDTTGTAQANIDAGRSLATMIRDRLVAVGLGATLLSVASHGEADLLVQTPDDTPEPRNRRVDVSVR